MQEHDERAVPFPGERDVQPYFAHVDAAMRHPRDVVAIPFDRDTRGGEHLGYASADETIAA